MKKTLTKSVKAARKKPGGSNVGKYSSKEKFAGPAGGAPPGSYPLTDDGKKDIARGKAAIKLSGNAPNPQGIKNAAIREYPSLGKKSKSKKKK